MIRSNIKIWSAVGAVAVSSLAGAAAASAADEFAGGTLAHALDKVFHGEGGEGGLGFTKMTRSFSVPALTEGQLREVFGGNTLSQKGKVAAHLRPDGKIEGWYSVDREVSFERCPKQNDSGDNLFIHDGKQCMHRSFEPFRNASWSIKGDQLCIPDSVGGGAGGSGCYYAALVLNNVALFGEDGKMLGKGKDLARGSSVPAMPPNK